MAKPNKDRKGSVRSLIAPLTRKQARKEIRAEAKLAYGDKLRDYGKQIGASKQQSRQINQWYGQYRNDVAALQGSQRDATDRLGAYSRSWSNDAANRSGAETSRVSGEEDRSAAIRGALPNSGMSDTDRAAEEQRNNLRQSYADQTFRTGVANENMLGQLRNASFSGLRDDQRRERNIRLNIQKDRNATKKEMGAFKVAQGAVKRKEERDWNYQNRTLNSENRNAAANRALDWATENRLRNEGSGSGGSGGSGGGGRGGYKPGEVRGATAQLRVQLEDMGISHRDPTTIRKQKTRILDQLISPPNALDAGLARAAYRRILKKAQRWDRNPNNPGSSAWRPGR